MISDERRQAGCRALGFSFGMALSLAAGMAYAADSGAPQAPADERPASVDGVELRLRSLQDTIDASDTRRKVLATDIESYKTDRAHVLATLLELTTRTSADDTKLADAEARLKALSTTEEATRQSLDKRRAVVAEVLAALQRMGRKPPPALLVEPNDVLKAMRTSMLLGAVLPGMRAEAEALMADLERQAQTRRAIEAERDLIDKEVTELASERTRLSALVEARQDALGKAQSDLDEERDKAKQLAERTGSLKELIAKMEVESAAAAQGAAAAKRSDQLATLAPPGVPLPQGGVTRDPARLTPAVAFATTKGNLPLPVSGSVLRRFGDDDGLGSTERGMLFATRAAAMVASPADGWIAYAGPYRSFGQLLILNVGGGYYIVLAGMDRVNVSLGQFVLAGEPVAVMGDGSTKTAAAVALGAAQPVLYVEFRKDGAVIDPGPWWAKPELQRVRG